MWPDPGPFYFPHGKTENRKLLATQQSTVYFSCPFLRARAAVASKELLLAPQSKVRVTPVVITAPWKLDSQFLTDLHGFGY